MWRKAWPLLALISVGLCLLVDARPSAPPPPAADLAQQVLATQEATASALAAEAPQTGFGYKDLQGTVVDSSEGIANAVRPSFCATRSMGTNPCAQFSYARPRGFGSNLHTSCDIVGETLFS